MSKTTATPPEAPAGSRETARQTASEPIEDGTATQEPVWSEGERDLELDDLLETERDLSHETEDDTKNDKGSEDDEDLPPDFEKWFRKHREPVYRYVRFRVATREIAEDLTSESFMKALRALDTYNPKRSSPRTWLLRIARNTVTDHIRGLQRKGSLHVSLDRAPDLASHCPSQEERMIREEEVQGLLNAVATLRKTDREIISLRYGSGLSNKEIAETLKISPNAVAVRLHRALGRLKEAMTDPDDE